MLPPGEALALTRWQTVQVNEKTFETSVEGVFSGGDVVTGAATAIEAIAAGRKAAYAIDSYIREGVVRPEPEEFISRKDVFAKVGMKDLRGQEQKPKRHIPMLPVDQRVNELRRGRAGLLGGRPQRGDHPVPRVRLHGAVRLRPPQVRDRVRRRREALPRRGSAARARPRRTRSSSSTPTSASCAAAASASAATSSACRPTASSTAGSAPSWRPRSAGRCSTPSACPAACASAPARPAPSRSTCRSPSRARGRPSRPRASATTAASAAGSTTTAFGDTLVKVSRNEANDVTFGNHCRKGRFGFNFVHAQDRLLTGRVRTGEVAVDASVDEAVTHAAARLKELARKCSGREIAVFVSPRLTNEEIYLAQKFARVALRTHNVTSFSHLVNRELFAPDVLATATYPDLAQAQAILVVQSGARRRALRRGSDCEAGHPERRQDGVRRAERRTGARGSPSCSSSARRRPRRWSCRRSSPRPRRLAGQEPAAGAGGRDCRPDAGADRGEDRGSIRRGSPRRPRSSRAASARCMVFNRDYRGARRAGDVRWLAAAGAALGCGVLPLHEKSNAQGLLDMGANPAWYPGYRPVTDPATIDDLEKAWSVSLRDLDTTGVGRGAVCWPGKQIKVAVVLGEDPLGADELAGGTPGGPRGRGVPGGGRPVRDEDRRRRRTSCCR